MNSIFSLMVPILLLFAISGPAHAGDWRSRYTTANEFESCCGERDCHTAASLGYPAMKRNPDGSYDVRIQGHWLTYHHPAVHVSEDTNIWICYLESNAEPDPLCLFFPPGVS